MLHLSCLSKMITTFETTFAISCQGRQLRQVCQFEKIWQVRGVSPQAQAERGSDLALSISHRLVDKSCWNP